MAKQGSRNYVAVLRAHHRFTDPFLQDICKLCTSEERDVQLKWSTISRPTRSLRHLAFRLAARGAAVTHEMLVREECAFPFPLLCIDYAPDPLAVARELLQRSECEKDAWSKDFLHRYASEEAVLSQAAMAERQVLLQQKLCTTRIEARHSGIRRLVASSALQAKAPNLGSVSADFLRTHPRKAPVGPP